MPTIDTPPMWAPPPECRGRILGRNPDKRFPPLLFTVTSTALPWDLHFFKLTQPLTGSTVQLLYTDKEKGRKPDRKPYSLSYGLRIHTETSSLRTVKIIPRNLNEIVHSWIRLLNKLSHLWSYSPPPPILPFSFRDCIVHGYKQDSIIIPKINI